jgi:cytidylate kinase
VISNGGFPVAIITVSRGPMTGGKNFAERLAATLGYECLAHEVVVQAARKIGVSEELLDGKIEKSAGVWERLTEHRRLYLVAVQSALADACLSGNLIYHGHAGHLLLKGVPALLRVRLVTSMALRIRALRARQGLTYEAAREYIRDFDHERVRWTKFVYGVDWNDPTNYDVVFNMADMSIDSACAMVAGVARLPPYCSTEAVKKELKDFALACRVKLVLAENAESQAISFNVIADDGKVEVFGEIAGGGLLMKQAGPSEEEIRRIVEAIEGVKALTVDLHWFAESDDL